MKPASVQLKNIHKSFFTFRGRVPVLCDINIEIAPGEFFVLLGPSGCGKSTLLNVIAGLEKPGSGEIIIDENVVTDTQKKIFIDPHKRDIALVFQSYALYPHMRVKENIAFPLKNLQKRLSKAEIDKKVNETAQLLQIENLLERKPSELSGGQRQRVAIGRAIVRRPKLFLMDEPLSNLDAQLRMEMRAQLKDLQRRLHITTIYVTHDQMEAMTLGDRIAVLFNGTIQQTGKPSEVYAHPINPFVAGFIGSPPMNLIKGGIIEEGGMAIFRNQNVDIFIPGECSIPAHVTDRGACIMGIRPENIALGNPGEGNIDVSITVVENIGSEYLLHIFLKEGTHIIVKSGHRPQSTNVSLIFPADKILFFNG